MDPVVRRTATTTATIVTRRSSVRSKSSVSLPRTPSRTNTTAAHQRKTSRGAGRSLGRISWCGVVWLAISCWCQYRPVVLGFVLVESRRHGDARASTTTTTAAWNHPPLLPQGSEPQQPQPSTTTRSNNRQDPLQDHGTDRGGSSSSNGPSSPTLPATAAAAVSNRRRRRRWPLPGMHWLSSVVRGRALASTATTEDVVSSNTTTKNATTAIPLAMSTTSFPPPTPLTGTTDTSTIPSTTTLVTTATTATTTTTTTTVTDDAPVHVTGATTTASDHTVTVHTYVDPATQHTWMALTTSGGRSKFLAYLHYSGVATLDDDDGNSHSAVVHTRYVSVEPHQDERVQRMRAEWRTLWKAGRLLTDRTELLAVYPSDDDNDDEHGENEKDDIATSTSLALRKRRRRRRITTGRRTTRKRGGFGDLLSLYTDRLLAILQDEDDEAVQTTQTTLLSWLQQSYGSQQTSDLMYDSFRQLDETQQLRALKDFLEWFRHDFPYFYDRCGACGASVRDDAAAAAVEQANNNNNNSSDNDDVDNNGDDSDEHRTFCGYIYPNPSELEGKASRTELYRCHVCSEFTRFPRFNSAHHVVRARRGRCGEYSMLLYRLLRVLGHECRWAVDWADHVWAEIHIVPRDRSTAARWVHLDPCEAAVDENLIYQGWGKKQTYILGFYLPRRHDQSEAEYPLVEDITQSYTSESWAEICQRREESEQSVLAEIQKAKCELHTKLSKHGRL